MPRTRFKLAFCLFALAGLFAVTAGAAMEDGRPKSDSTAAQKSESAGLRVANAYLAACSKADFDALNGLFLDGGRATVLENASDEGTWEQYRDHHLMPELKEFDGITVNVESEVEQKFGATSVVRQIGSFEVPDPATPSASRKYSCAVTYVIVDDAGAPRIAHLALVQPRRQASHNSRAVSHRARPQGAVLRPDTDGRRFFVDACKARR